MSADRRSWPQTDRVWRQFERFDLVMERVRVDRLRAVREDEGKALAAARDICLACRLEERCRRLLAREDDAAAVVAICPNAGFLGQCRRQVT